MKICNTLLLITADRNAINMRLKTQLAGMLLIFFIVLIIAYYDLSRMVSAEQLGVDEHSRHRVLLNSDFVNSMNQGDGKENKEDYLIDPITASYDYDVDNDKVHPEPAKAAASTILLVTISPFIIDLLRPFLQDTLGNGCVYSIYDSFHSSIPSTDGCGTIIALSHQPLYSTRAQLLQYDQLIYLDQDLGGFILDCFRRDFQTTISETIVEGALFRSYAQAKSQIWKWHRQYYHQRQPGNSSAAIDTRLHWLSITEDPTALLSALGLASTDSQIYNWGSYQRLIKQSNRQRLDIQQYSARIHSIINSDGLTNGRSDEIHLISSYYRSLVPQRRMELETAILLNVNNSAITMVHLFITVDERQTENSDVFLNALRSHDKVTFINIERQPVYADMFTYANRHLSGHIVLIQNSDIHWQPGSMDRLRETLRPLLVYALSRHSNCEDRQSDGTLILSHNRDFCKNYAGSHDAFAFVPPVDPIILEELHFKQNTWSGENVVIEALRYGAGINLS